MTLNPNPRIYIETSVISYLTARPNRDLIAQARQQASRELWEARERFEFCISPEVIREISAGDTLAAQERLVYASQMTLLTGSAPVNQIADILISRHALPSLAYPDALHIAHAALYGMNYIVSWNFRHISGVQQRRHIEAVLRDLGYAEVAITTPIDLLEGEISC